MRATPIPQRSRFLVRSRNRDRCERCMVPAPHGQWHHRRTRAVKDSHTHCPCNGVWLCETCHRWAHANPTQATETGWLISRHVDWPGTLAFKTPFGWRVPDCKGKWSEAL